jgi:hypothetical protein
LSLAGEEFLHTRLVIEGLVGLRPIIGESFLQARAAELYNSPKIEALGRTVRKGDQGYDG